MKHRRFLSIFLINWVLLLGLPYLITGQSYFNKIHTLGTTDGLVSPWVTSVYQDYDGFMWIGTRDGLHQYDGQQMTYIPDLLNEPLLKESTSSIYQSRDSTIWICHVGLSAINLKTKQIVHFNYNPNDSTGIGAGIIKSVFEDATGNLWVASIRNGLMLLDRKTGQFTYFLPETTGMNKTEALKMLHTKNIVSDDDDPDILWVSGRSGLLKFNKKTGIFINFNNQEAPKDDLTNIWMDDLGVIWCGSYAGLLRFDPGSEKWSEVELNFKGKSINNVVDIQYKSPDEFWILNSNLGPGIYNWKEHQLEMPDENTLYSGNIQPSGYSQFYFGEGQILWVCSKKGISILDPLRNQFLNAGLPGLKNEPDKIRYTSTTFLKDNGNMILSASGDNRLFEFDKKLKFVKFHYPLFSNGKRLESDITYLKPGDQHSIWIESGGNIYKYQTLTSTIRLVFDKALFDGKLRGVLEIMEDSKGNLWLGTQRNGLFHVDVATGTTTRWFETNAVPDSVFLKYEYVSDIYEDNLGKIWFTGNWGVHCLEHKDGEMRSFGNWSSRGIIQSTDGSFWIGTHGDGLIRLSNPQEGNDSIQIFNTSNGLKSDIIHRLISDVNGDIWFTHTKGLSRINPQTFTFRHFDALDGLPDNSNLEGHLMLLKNRMIYLAYEDRISLFDPNKIRSQEDVKEVQITSFKLFNKELELEKDILYTDAIHLNYDQNFFTLDFVARNLSMPERNSYAYRLKGLEDEWNECTNCSSANYTDVKPGTYVFEVKYSKNKSLMEFPPKSLRIRISPPYWQTIWFRILTLISIFSTIWILYRYRIHQIREKDKIKQQLNELELKALRSQMNPHFLFNSLNSIKRFIIKNEPHMAADYLNTFSSLMRQVLNNSSHSKIKLSEEITALQHYIELESLRFQEKFNYQIMIDNKVQTEHIYIPPMILQPYVENAIWHGIMHKEGRGEICLSFEMDKNKEKAILICTIEDNGIGRLKASRLKSKSATLKKSMGMQMTANRLEILRKMKSMDTEVTVRDLYDEYNTASGTRVTIKIAV